MPVEIDGEQIASFTIVITRGGAYINQWAFLDENGSPTPLLDAKIIVEPRTGSSEEWNAANGRFTNVSPGVYLLSLNEAYTTAIAWDAGNYHVYVVEDSGITVPCITAGLLFAENC